MRYILSRQNREVLAQLAWSNVLLAFDFDGTLSPIVNDPEAAKMRTRTRRLFAALAQRYPCVVISGRGVADVGARLGDANVRAVVGNHGLEPAGDMQRFEQEVRAFLPRLTRALAGLEGVEIEDKRYSVAVHYRRSRSRRTARELIAEAVAVLGDAVRAVPGKCVVNVLPEGAPHKGFALRSLQRELSADVALYVGDDETDEDVFNMEEPGHLLGIRVGKSMRSRASYFLTSQREIDELLGLLVSLRESAASRRMELS
ncbi:MAG: trehalose-phosphatase [Myxococcales bacterium]